MHRYIGLDVHAASTTMAVVGPTGRRIRSQVLDTSAGPLVEALRGIGGERHVCLEEGTQSSWLYEVLEPDATEVVVCGTSVLMQHRSDPLYEVYRRGIDGGTKPNLARLTLARKLAAIALSMWKSSKEYDPAQVIAHES